MVARLKDIAQDLGLSVVTISKVLRNHPDIGEQTRKRVLKRMKAELPAQLCRPLAHHRPLLDHWPGCARPAPSFLCANRESHLG